MNNNIILVDDDVNALSGYVRNIKNKFNISIATSGKEALSIIRNAKEKFAIVVSDYRMPEMDGIKFLSLVKTISPDTVRVMLTGYADAQTAISAVNEGNIFRLLTKPCSVEDFIKTLKSCIEQYQLINAEKELLDRTLKGSINVLTDILTIINPLAFSHTSRLRSLTREIAEKTEDVKLWEVEIASLLSHIGCINVPTNILEKKFRINELTEEEEKIFSNHTQIGRMLLKNIPRLENIADAIGEQLKPYSSINKTSNYSKIANILKLVNDYDLLILSGKESGEALDILKKRKDEYDPNLLTLLEAVLFKIEAKYIVRKVAVHELNEGMVMIENIYDDSKVLLVSKGQEVSDVLRLHLMSYIKMKKIKNEFKVLIPLKN